MLERSKRQNNNSAEKGKPCRLYTVHTNTLGVTWRLGERAVVGYLRKQGLFQFVVVVVVIAAVECINVFPFTANTE